MTRSRTSRVALRWVLGPPLGLVLAAAGQGAVARDSALGTCSVVAVTVASRAPAVATAAATPVDDFVEYTYAVPAGPVGSFADCPIERTFPDGIESLRVTLVSGTADDIGFVGDLQVTNAPPSCSAVGQVAAAVDVTSQVTVDGNTARLTLRAMENCCCVTGWGQATQADRSNALIHWEVNTGAPAIEITLDPPPPGDRYTIDASPAMPAIRAKARVVGVTPDPTPTTTFTWSASLEVHENVPSRDVDFADEIVQGTTTTGEALYTLQLEDPAALRGGQLQLKATATVDGNPLTGETPAGLRIEGTNPQRAALQSYLDGENVNPGHGLGAGDVRDALKRIACQESQQREFRAAANGGVGPALISGDDGVGVFQITNSPCDPFAACREVIFDWRANVDHGIRAFREKVGIAVGYPRNLRRSQQYQDFVDNTINPQRVAAGRRPIQNAPAPGFSTAGLLGAATPNQLLEDAVRGYNGFAGNLYGLALHEWAPDTDFLLAATDAQLRGIQNDAAVWRRVTAAERPAAGDPAYVANVTGRAPQCGG
jgi:hypothetical protein